MSSSEVQPVPSATPPQPTAPRRRKKVSMERVMLLFTLFFIAGVLLLVLVPEGPSRALAMTVYTVLVFWTIFRFGI